ncbi:MAG: response regulator transcription factor [Bacteroidota bacterium]
MKIAIADDEALFRKGLARLFADFGATLAFEATNGQDLLQQLDTAEQLPDVLLLDLNMPTMNGIEAAKIIHKKYPELKFIILSTYYSKAFITKMIEFGAAGYLAKNASPQEMATCIQEVADKGFYYDQKVMEVLRESMMNKSRPVFRNPFGVALSEREREVLQLICEELTTAEIAAKLFLSPRTVDGHRNSLLQKLNCRNTAGLVIVALQEQLVDITKIRF